MHGLGTVGAGPGGRGSAAGTGGRCRSGTPLKRPCNPPVPSAGVRGLFTVARIATACRSGWVNPGAVPRGSNTTRLGGQSPRGRGSRSYGAYNRVTDTTFESDPEAPLASVTVTVIVKLRGRTMI